MTAQGRVMRVHERQCPGRLPRSGGLKNQVQRLANPVAANSIAMASSGVFQLRV